MTHYRQGDVLLRKIEDDHDISEAEVQQRDNGRVVLAYGEVTGHAHAIHEMSATMYVTPEGRILDLSEDTPLIHEEHDTITLPPGRYEVIQQREYTPTEIRNVLD